MQIIHQSLSDLNIPITLFQQEVPVSKIALILPGVGYTCQGPLLHYTTGLYLSNGYNVIHVNYNQLIKNWDSKQFSTIITKTIQSLNLEDLYSSIHLVAKSIGTVALTEVLEQCVFETSNVKTIWFTPLLTRNDVSNAMVHTKTEGLVFIGDKDPCYQVDEFELIKNNERLSLHLIPETNHSLEWDMNVFTSIKIMTQLMKEVERFIK